MATSAKLFYPTGIAFDSYDNLYLADERLHRVRRIDAQTGIISTVVGGNGAGGGGDGGAPTSAQLNTPRSVAFDPHGILYVGEMYGNRVRKVDFGANTIQLLAGTGTGGFSGDEISATSAKLYYPEGMAWGVADGVEYIYIADTRNERVRAVAIGEAPPYPPPNCYL